MTIDTELTFDQFCDTNYPGKGPLMVQGSYGRYPVYGQNGAKRYILCMLAIHTEGLYKETFIGYIAKYCYPGIDDKEARRLAASRLGKVIGFMKDCPDDYGLIVKKLDNAYLIKLTGKFFGKNLKRIQTELRAKRRLLDN